MKVAGVIPAAGLGERLGGGVPKAFVSLGDRPLLAYTIDALDLCPDVDSFVLVVPAGREAEAADLAGRSDKFAGSVAGGDTRQASVALGLRALPEDADTIVIHDVARPFATAGLFSRVVAALRSADGAVPVMPVTDTVKRVDDGAVSETVARDGLVLAQTPQAFRRTALQAAHARAEAEGVVATDDAALVERSGFRVVTVDGEPGNFKITTPEDLRRAALVRTSRG